MKRDEIKRDFLSITGAPDGPNVTAFLEANNWVLDRAINKFYDNPFALHANGNRSEASNRNSETGVTRKRYGTTKSHVIGEGMGNSC